MCHGQVSHRNIFPQTRIFFPSEYVIELFFNIFCFIDKIQLIWEWNYLRLFSEKQKRIHCTDTVNCVFRLQIRGFYDAAAAAAMVTTSDLPLHRSMQETWTEPSLWRKEDENKSEVSQVSHSYTTVFHSYTTVSHSYTTVFHGCTIKSFL